MSGLGEQEFVKLFSCSLSAYMLICTKVILNGGQGNYDEKKQILKHTVMG